MKIMSRSFVGGVLLLLAGYTAGFTIGVNWTLHCVYAIKMKEASMNSNLRPLPQFPASSNKPTTQKHP